MTVRSKQHPPLALSAKIFELPVMRKAAQSNSVSLQSRPPSMVSGKMSGAQLLSIRQHLSFKASLAFTDVEYIELKYSPQVAEKLIAYVRQLLDQEFGPLRVHRRRQSFVVSHRCMDSLVAGLLRVQFHSCQIPLPATRETNGFGDVCGVPLSWGVGKTLEEAETERLEKQKSEKLK